VVHLAVALGFALAHRAMGRIPGATVLRVKPVMEQSAGAGTVFVNRWRLWRGSDACGSPQPDDLEGLAAVMRWTKPASLLVVFHTLQRAVAFADLGADHLDRVGKHRTAKRLVRRLGALGYKVMLRPKVAA
jgi:hypothetical protein